MHECPLQPYLSPKSRHRKRYQPQRKSFHGSLWSLFHDVSQLPFGKVFPEVHSSISFPYRQKLAIHPYKRNPSYCHLRFLPCKGIAVLTDSKQRSVTRYRRRYFSADFRNLGILKNIIVDYLPYCHIRLQLIKARKNKVTTT